MRKKEEIKNIERLEMMEDKLDITLEGIYAEYETIEKDDKYLCVRGEIRAVKELQLQENIEIIVTAYNAEGKVIATGSEFFSAKKFFGLSPFDICVDIIEKPVKVRVYPKIA